MRISLFATLLLLPLSACTFVKMGPGAAQVKVVALGKDMSACEKRGEVVVSVKDRLGPYSRDDLRVRDELETLARNEAPSLKANTVQPKEEPQAGEQRFFAYQCGNVASPNTAPSTTTSKDSAETLPLKD